MLQYRNDPSLEVTLVHYFATNSWASRSSHLKTLDSNRDFTRAGAPLALSACGELPDFPARDLRGVAHRSAL
jgi:hypothetical protein